MRRAGDLPYPEPTNEAVSQRMRRNRKVDSKPEVALRSMLHRRGYRFRKHLPVRTAERLIKPDIVFTRTKLAVFVDGCFWHCCPSHGTQPRANTDYWGPKLARNVARDKAVNKALKDAGWRVIRAWEHDDPRDVADRVERALATV